jgi:glycosyltransferase involved in cell wall biosynthesis
MPVYNAEKPLGLTLQKVPRDVVNIVLLVDDGSADQTVIVANHLGIKHVVPPRNQRYVGKPKNLLRPRLGGKRRHCGHGSP